MNEFNVIISLKDKTKLIKRCINLKCSDYEIVNFDGKEVVEILGRNPFTHWC